MSKLLSHAVMQRVSGERPSSPRALGAAFVVGGAAATITYRVLRHEQKG